jgi:hypothetical protein
MRKNATEWSLGRQYERLYETTCRRPLSINMLEHIFQIVGTRSRSSAFSTTSKTVSGTGLTCVMLLGVHDVNTAFSTRRRNAWWRSKSRPSCYGWTNGRSFSNTSRPETVLWIMFPQGWTWWVGWGAHSIVLIVPIYTSIIDREFLYSLCIYGLFMPLLYLLTCPLLLLKAKRMILVTSQY